MPALGKRGEIVRADGRRSAARQIDFAVANLWVTLNDDAGRCIGPQQRELDIRYRHVDKHEAAIDPGRDRRAGAHEVAGSRDQTPDIGFRRRLDRLKTGGFVGALDAGENFLRAFRLDLGIGKFHGGACRDVGFETCRRLLQAPDTLLRLVEIGLGPDHRRRILKRILDGGYQPVLSDAVADMQRLACKEAIDGR
jgi:hypothetical protein